MKIGQLYKYSSFRSGFLYIWKKEIHWVDVGSLQRDKDIFLFLGQEQIDKEFVFKILCKNKIGYINPNSELYTEVTIPK